ncbi:MAG: hypothetical protein ACI4N3_04875 [Alphaproteobacteria bacterium]
MNRKASIMVSAFICVALSRGANSKSLTEALQDYCVPVYGFCTSKATYVEFPGSGGGCGFCRCSSISKYYDKLSRSCRDCISGSFASNYYKRCEPIVCPAGYEAKLISNGVCPSGYSLQKITNGACPSGYGLKEYVVSSKSWR